MHRGRKSLPMKKNRNTKSLRMFCKLNSTRIFDSSSLYSISKYSLNKVTKMSSKFTGFSFFVAVILTWSEAGMNYYLMMHKFLIGKVIESIIRSASAPYKQWESYGSKVWILALINSIILCSPSPGTSDPVKTMFKVFQ